MAISKQQRGLIVVSNLETSDPGRWDELYQFLSGSGDFLANHILTPKYGHTKRLLGGDATSNNFIAALKTMAANPVIKKIDVIINLHGNSNKLRFDNGKIIITDLKAKILALNIASKLRMLYSTACFGANHAPRFIEAGFDVAAGSVGVNANSAVEYPVVLTMWGNGFKFNNCISVGENPLTRLPADAIARAMGFSGVNSDKSVFGNGNIKISS